MDMLVEKFVKNEFGNTQKIVKKNKVNFLIENGNELFKIIMSFGQQIFFKKKTSYSLFLNIDLMCMYTSKKKWHKLNKV